MWQFGAGWESPPDLDKQIMVLLNSLNADVQIWQNLTGRFHCYVGVGGYLNDWTGGTTLQPTTLKLLVERALAIDFDLYAPIASD